MREDLGLDEADAAIVASKALAQRLDYRRDSPPEGRKEGRDPLTVYVDEIRRYPLLDRDEEQALATRYRETGDADAARRLITSNLRLVVKIAHEYKRASGNLLDLVQEGNVGLVMALRKYDPDRGVRLSSYAVFWVRAYMLRFLLNNWHLVRIGTTPAQRKLFFNLRKEQARLEAGGYRASPAALAEVMKVSEADVAEMQLRLQAESSLDAPVGPDDDRTGLDTLPDDGELPDEAAAASELREKLREKIAAFGSQLQGRERTIFEERLLTEEPRTLQEIGQKYSISRERARQVEKQLVKKLKGYLKRELGDVVEVALDRAA
jgi:RNA polymerase sigma-32 factor